jgi:hypothetical protein
MVWVLGNIQPFESLTFSKMSLFKRLKWKGRLHFLVQVKFKDHLASGLYRNVSCVLDLTSAQHWKLKLT